MSYFPHLCDGTILESYCENENKNSYVKNAEYSPGRLACAPSRVLINNTDSRVLLVVYPFVFISMIMIQAFHNSCLQCKYNSVVLIHSMIENNDVFKPMRKLGG